MDKVEKEWTEEELLELARRKRKLRIISILVAVIFLAAAASLYIFLLSTSMGWPRPTSWPNYGPN